MSQIFPSSGKRCSWYPKADDEKIGVEAMSDEELQGLVPVSVEEAEVVDPIEGVVEIAIEEDAPCEDCEDIPGTPEDESLDSDGGSLEERAADLVDDVEAIKETLEDIAEDAKEVAALATGEELPEEGELEVEDAIEDAFEDEMSEEGELESETEGKVEDTEEDNIVVAGDTAKFVKVASISPENKKQLRDYWVNGLGYDAEYVDAMLQDYEK